MTTSHVTESGKSFPRDSHPLPKSNFAKLTIVSADVTVVFFFNVSFVSGWTGIVSQKHFLAKYWFLSGSKSVGGQSYKCINNLIVKVTFIWTIDMVITLPDSDIYKEFEDE